MYTSVVYDSISGLLWFHFEIVVVLFWVSQRLEDGYRGSLITDVSSIVAQTCFTHFMLYGQFSKFQIAKLQIERLKS